MGIQEVTTHFLLPGVGLIAPIIYVSDAAVTSDTTEEVECSR